MARGDAYPRRLREQELRLLEGILPSERPGYRHYRAMIQSMLVLAEGKRGAGHYILGQPETPPDLSLALPPVIALGGVEAADATYVVSIREFTGTQLDVEIVSSAGEEVPDWIEVKRHWTYSTWLPGAPSPATGGAVREVIVDSFLTLVVAPQEKRIWLYDRASGMNHLIPVTNFHNELMMLKGNRNPRVALNAGLFFADQAAYTDNELRETFIRYNAVRHRVNVQDPPPSGPVGGWLGTLKRLFGKERP